MKDKINGLIMFIGGLAIFFLLIIPQYKITTSEPQDLYEINADEIVEGTHITGEIDFVYDYYATESREKKTLGITTSTENDTARWYIFPAYGPTEADTRLLTVRISPSGYGRMNQIVEETWAYLEGTSSDFGQTTYSIDARAVKMDNELHQLYYDWYGTEVSREEADAYLTPYVLVPIMEMNTIVLVGALSIVLSIVGLVMLLKKEKKEYVPMAVSQGAYEQENPYDGYQ